MEEHIPQSELKRRILKQRGITGFEPRTKRPLTPDQMPQDYHRTRLMLYLELKFRKPIHELIYQGTIYATAAKLGIDATTVSKWRKLLPEG